MSTIPPPRRPRRGPPTLNTIDLVRAITPTWRKRLPLVMRALAVGFVGFLLWLRSGHFEEQVRLGLQDVLSDVLGEGVAVAEVDLQWLPLELELSGLQVQSRHPERAGDEIVTVERIGVRRPWFDPLARRLSVRAVEVHHPSLDLRFKDGWLMDFSALQNLLVTASGGGTPIEVVVDSAELRGGRLELIADRPELSIVLEGIGLSASQSSGAEAEGSLGVGEILVEVAGVAQEVALTPGIFELAGPSVSLRDYRLILPGGAFSLDAELDLSAGRDQPLAYEFAVQGGLDLSEFAARQPEAPDLRGQLELDIRGTGEGQLPRLAGRLEWSGAGLGRHAFGNIASQVRFQRRTLELTDLDIANYGGWLGGEVRIHLFGSLPLEADLRFRGLHFERILAAHTRTQGSHVTFDLGGRAELSGQLIGLELAGPVEARVADLVVMNGSWRQPDENRVFLDVEGGTLRGGLSIGPGRISWTDAAGWFGETYLSSTGSLYPRPGRPLALDIDVAGTPFDFSTVPVIAGLDFSGRGGLEGTLLGPANDLEIQAELSAADFRFMGFPLGDVETGVRWHTRESLSLRSLAATAGATSYRGDVDIQFEGGVSLDASVEAEEGRLEDIKDIFFAGVDLGGELSSLQGNLSGPPTALSGTIALEAGALQSYGQGFTSADVGLRMSEGRLLVERGVLRLAEGGLYAQGSFSELSGRAELDLRAFSYGLRAADVDWLDGLSDLGGDLQLDLVLGGSIPSPEVRAQLSGDGLAWRGRRFGQLEASARLADRELRLSAALPGERLQLDGTMRTDGLWPYQAEARASDLDLSFLLPEGVADEEGVREARLTIGAVVEGSGTVRDGVHRLTLRGEEARLAQGRYVISNERPFELRYHDGAFQLPEVRLLGTNTDLHLTGRLVPGGPLSFRVRGSSHLWLLNALQPVLVRGDAESAWLDLEGTGTTQYLELRGEASLENAVVQTVFFPHPIQVDEALFSLADRVLELRSFRGSLGRGELRAGGTIRLDTYGYRPRVYDLYASCADCSLRYPSFLPPARGSAELAFQGRAPDALVMSGEIRLDEMVLRDRMDWQASLLRRATFVEGLSEEEEDEDPLFGFDIEVLSEGGVRLANNLGRASVEGAVRVVGDTQRIGLIGRGRATRGAVNFRGRNFELEEGYFVFPEDDPFSYNPRFDIALRTEVPTETQDYELLYRLTGSLEEPLVLASSNPDVSEADINSLLLFGDLADEVAVGAVLSALVGEGVGAGLAGLIPVDRLEVDTVSSDLDGELAVRIRAVKRFLEEQLEVSVFATVAQEVGFGVNSELAVPGWPRLQLSWERASDNGFGGLLPVEIGALALDLKAVFEAD